MKTTKRIALSIAAASLTAAVSTAPASAVSALFCHSIGQHLSNGHCCPKNQDWFSNGTGTGAGACAHLALGIDDPRDPPPSKVETPLCKALHTC